jgi:hypothetical protein
MSKLKVDQISKATGAAPAIFTLPAADGTADQHMKTDGSGQLGWSTPPAAATNTPAFCVCTNAITAITAATNTKIVLDREVFDSDGAFDATTNYRFTVPAGEAGKYFFSGAIAYLITGTIGSAGSNNQIQIHVNGTETGTVSKAESNQSNTTSIVMTGSWCLDLSVADYVEMWGYISSSGTPTLQYNGNATIFRTYMTGFKLAGV